MSPDRVRVAIVDDSEIFVRALRRMLERRPSVQVVGCTTDPEEALPMVTRARPEVLLIDLKMPRTTGAELTRLVRAQHPEIGIVALTVSDDQSDLLDMLRAGARGYVLKSSTVEEIVQAVGAAARGEGWLSSRMAGQLISEFTRLPAAMLDGIADLGLTSREQAVLRHLTTGQTNREIAEQLGVAETTVKSHLRNILEKLHLRNRVEAVLVAMRASGTDRVQKDAP